MKRITLATTVLTVGLFAGSLAGVNPALADDTMLGSDSATWGPFLNVPPPIIEPVGSTPNYADSNFEGLDFGDPVGFSFIAPNGCSTFDVGMINCTVTSNNTIFPIPTDADTAKRALDVKVDLSKGIESSIALSSLSVRSKTTDGYTIRNSKRITAMARHFVNNPGDIINIHAYGPDKDIALAKGHIVREQLQDDITRLGGDPANYPTFVTYAGNPDHKKDVDVTIHQHVPSSITVSEGETLTIGGNS